RKIPRARGKPKQLVHVTRSPHLPRIQVERAPAIRVHEARIRITASPHIPGFHGARQLGDGDALAHEPEQVDLAHLVRIYLYAYTEKMGRRKCAGEDHEQTRR